MTFSAPIVAPMPPEPGRVGDRAGGDDRALARSSAAGTEAMVPMPPGLVRVMFAPTRSSAVSVFVRAFSTSAS